MTYYKIIMNNDVIGVGCTFLKWNTARHKLHICNVDQGQFVQSVIDQNIYRAEWMKPAPQEADHFTLAKVEIVNAKEFDELKELLLTGETVHEPEPVIEEVVQETSAPEEEYKPLTIAQMRELILSQQKEIDALKKALTH